MKSFSSSPGPKSTHEDNRTCNGMAFTYGFVNSDTRAFYSQSTKSLPIGEKILKKKLKYYCLCLFCTIIKYDTLAIYNEQNLYKITVLVAEKSEMRVLEFTFFLARYPIEDKKR